MYIYVAEATTVDTFALDVTMYFAKLPYFGQLQMMIVLMINLFIEKKVLTNFIRKRVHRPHFILLIYL